MAHLHCRVRALALKGPRPQLFPVLRRFWFCHGEVIASSGGVGREQVCVCVWRPFLVRAGGMLLSCSHASASFALPHLSACEALITDDSIKVASRFVEAAVIIAAMSDHFVFVSRNFLLFYFCGTPVLFSTCSCRKLLPVTGCKDGEEDKRAAGPEDCATGSTVRSTRKPSNECPRRARRLVAVFCTQRKECGRTGNGPSVCKG